MNLVEFHHDRYRGGPTPIFINPEEVASVTSARNAMGESDSTRNESVITLKNGQQHSVTDSERVVVKKLTGAK